MTGTQSLEPSFVAFPGILIIRELGRSGAVRAGIGAHMRCQHYRQWLSLLLCHNTTLILHVRTKKYLKGNCVTRKDTIFYFHLEVETLFSFENRKSRDMFESERRRPLENKQLSMPAREGYNRAGTGQARMLEHMLVKWFYLAETLENLRGKGNL